MAIEFSKLLSGTGGFKSTGFARDGVRHCLKAYRVTNPAWNESPYPQWDTGKYYFSRQIGGVWHDFEYWTENTGHETLGYVGAHPPSDGYFDNADPAQCYMEYSNAQIPVFPGKGLYKMPFNEDGVLAAKVNSTLAIAGSITEHVYDGNGWDSYTETVTDIAADSEHSAHVGILGVQKNADGTYTYGPINCTLPDFAADHATRALDVTNLLKAIYETFKPNYDAFVTWPVIEGITVTPGTVIGPEFMADLMQTMWTVTGSCVINDNAFAGTVRWLEYYWGVPILNLGSGGMTMNRTAVTMLGQALMDHKRAPAGTR